MSNTPTLSDQDIQQFQKHGAILVKNAVAPHWIQELNSVVDYQLTHPSRWGMQEDLDKKEDRMFTDRYLWKDNAVINRFIHESGCAKLAAQLMRSKEARFYFDHLIIKEPNTAEPTPWHQDIPYWPFQGKQICSIWLALTDATVEGSSLEFLSGSHTDGKYYMPQGFGQGKEEQNSEDGRVAWLGKGKDFDPVPDIEKDRSAYDVIGWDVKAGDALIFSAWTLHSARGNASSENRRAAISTRWLGDDAIWQPSEGTDPTVTQEDVCIQPGEAPKDDNVFPLIYSEQ
jgi:ectoine hydroxylase-related dioxygenase (phytanoyl-CoA dioxygenase family)